MKTARDDLVSRTSRAIDALAPAGARCLVAVSGGPDSLALLDLLSDPAATHHRSLVVGHVDHGIGAGSAGVAERVADIARQRGLAFHQVRLELGPDCSETTARRARRAALREMAGSSGAELIVLGHHADDQAETVLLRVLRGSGPAGLAGMAARRGVWIRPLLGMSRDELAQHLRSRGLEAWQDPANSDPRHLRSWLRKEVIPVLGARLPDLISRLGELAAQAGASRRGWDSIPALVPALEHQTSARGISVAAPSLLGYRSEVRHAVLAALGRRFGVPLGTRRLAAIDRLLRNASGSGRVQLASRLEAELAFGRLTFQKTGLLPPQEEWPLEPSEGHPLGEARLTVGHALAAGVTREGWETTLAPGRYVARTWRPGDRIRPLGGAGTRAVSVLFREARISPRRRPGWPVIASSDDATIVWVPGICRSDAHVPMPGTEALHVECAFT